MKPLLYFLVSVAAGLTLIWVGHHRGYKEGAAAAYSTLPPGPWRLPDGSLYVRNLEEFDAALDSLKHGGTVTLAGGNYSMDSASPGRVK